MAKTKNEDEYLNNLRHTGAHLLAKAVKDLWPGTHNAIGPAIENGFYQDFDFGDRKISENDLSKIEAKMREILPSWHHFEYNEVSLAGAKKLFKDNPYKIELAEEFATGGKKLLTNDPGNFLDLCKMGHVENPAKEMQNFKLLSVAGAYWRGSEKNKMLTRIYGTVFPTKEELDKYLEQLRLAEERDHRKIGAKMDLWTFSDLVGAGLPLFSQKGALVRRLICEFVEELQSQQGIVQVWTPQIAKAELFKISGHYDKYRENMMHVRSNYSDEEFLLKPMNCPQHTQIYASQQRSYKDLPLRFADFAMLYRDEKPGELLGLARTRSFSQDDCHIFCREDQVEEEMAKAIEMTRKIMDTYGFSYKYRLSTRDPTKLGEYFGDPKLWDKAEKLSEKILKDHKLDYFDGPGEAAFYAPKLDLVATDSLGREWQLSTLQIDYVQPTRFQLVYIDKKGQRQTPVMLHRAIVGSPERLMAILIEHYGGAFPTWLAPVQVTVLPIADRHCPYAETIREQLTSNSIRSEIDDRAETLSAKIRDAQMQKVPYMIVVGDAEEKEGKIALRSRDRGDLGKMELQKFREEIRIEIKERKIVKAV